ncbi:alpha-amylase family glycosyl hydrolase, partial [Salmonella enterica]
WHSQSEQYYLHLFAPEQADLNWENPAVRAELKKGWHSQSEQYYLHLFAPEQADLNWENPAVRAELK